MSRRLALAFLSCAVVGALTVPPMAGAIRSYEGDDYSYDDLNVTRVVICDRETDGSGAYAKFRPVGTNSDSRVDDGNGSQSGCGYTTQFSRVYLHQACEQRRFVPDGCGNRVYP
jgi:hypothetical protein